MQQFEREGRESYNRLSFRFPSVNLEDAAQCSRSYSMPQVKIEARKPREEGVHTPLVPPAWPPPAAPWLLGPESKAKPRPPVQPLTFVLIHGAWADSSFWNGVAADLRSKGHTVYTPEYPGHGEDPNKAVTHAVMTHSLAQFIISRQLRSIVLVGHSFGGSLVQKIAELLPDRIKRLVFLDAFVLKDGESVADELPPASQQAFEQLRLQSAEDTIMLPYPLFRDAFVNLADAALAQQVYRRITPEPAGPLYEKLDLSKFYSLQLPASYVYLTEDNVLPQGGGYGWHPHMSGRLGLFRLIKASGDHMSTAITHPGRIAESLYEAGRD